MSSLFDEIMESDGFFGSFGGQFVPEVIRVFIDELTEAYNAIRADDAFFEDVRALIQQMTPRPTPLIELRNLSDAIGGARIWIKNEGMSWTGAHKINHCIGQIELAKRMKRTRIIAETGAGQHGVATASVCARAGLDCTIYMGETDYQRQRPNVFWMEQLGAKVTPVNLVDGTLNDAVIAALQDLATHPDETYYLLGSAVGPHPFPLMNAQFQSIVGEECRESFFNSSHGLPDTVYACVGGGSNALGIFLPFVDDDSVRLVGVEAGGHGMGIGQHALKATLGQFGIFEGYASRFLQDENGMIQSTASISAGLDYCGISPILAHLQTRGRVTFTSASDQEVLATFRKLASYDGVLGALESNHALAAAIRDSVDRTNDTHFLVNLSGRAEKDLFILMRHLQPDAYKAFLMHEDQHVEQSYVAT